jgi:hypothetical protein
MKLVLYTSHYNCSDLKRDREVFSVLYGNASLFDSVVLFWESSTCDLASNEMWKLLPSNLIIVPCSGRQHYKMFYDHSLDHFPEATIVMANSDVRFDYTIYRSKELEFNAKTAYALTRWDMMSLSEWCYPMQGKPCENWSFDSYIFRHPLEVDSRDLQIFVGIGGCDSYLVKKLVIDNRIRVYNPMIDIRTWHEDYREREKLRKDYFETKITHVNGQVISNYNQLEDYPWPPRVFGPAVQDYSSLKGIPMTMIQSVSPILLRPMVIRKGLKVISFSVYGSDPKYLRGAIRNCEQALHMYPDWKVLLYIHEKVNADPFRCFPNTVIIPFVSLQMAMAQRFRAIDSPEVEVMICRDADSRILPREVLAVDEWLRSGKTLHAMRDHPHHNVEGGHNILGGMWGLRKNGYTPPLDELIRKYSGRHHEWAIDMTLLNELYLNCVAHEDLLVHDSFGPLNVFTKRFPCDYDPECKFVGQYVSSDEEYDSTQAQLIRKSKSDILLKVRGDY